MARKKEEGALSGKKLRFVHLMANPEGHKFTVEEVCRILKISKNTYYKFKTDEQIIHAVNREVKKYADAYKARAWNNLMECCDEHSVSAIKLYFELLGDRAPDLDIHVTLSDD